MYWASIGGNIVQPSRASGVYVLGYMKSGTTWLCHLLSGALEIPILQPWTMNSPFLKPAIYHMHRFLPLAKVRRRTVYIMRDGRDAMVSAYFHVARENGNAKHLLERRFGRPFTAENAKSNLPDFILTMKDWNFSGPAYRQHIEAWKNHRGQFVTVRYEDLLTDPVHHLTKIITDLTGESPDAAKVMDVVHRNAFDRVTRRQPGSENPNEFLRKGIAGDWRNYFSPNAAAIFDAYAGDLLLELGYESDPNWARSL